MSSCAPNGGGLAAAEAGAQAKKAAQKIIDDLIASGVLGGASPAQILAAVNQVLPPLLDQELPDAVAAVLPDAVEDAVNDAVPAAVDAAVPQAVNTALTTQLPNAVSGAVGAAVPNAVNDALVPLVPQITANAVTQASTLAAQQATTQTLAQVNPQINTLSTQQTALQTSINGVQTTLEDLDNGQIPFFLEKPRNKTYIVVLKIQFAGTVTRFESVFDGAGAAVCNPPVGGAFAANSDITITISGTTTATRDFNASIYVERG